MTTTKIINAQTVIEKNNKMKVFLLTDKVRSIYNCSYFLKY